MTTAATAVWRVRPSGNNNNGGGFDCAISSAATGTHGSFTGTTFTDATAAAFTSGMVGSSINFAGGQYLISAFIDASNITLGSGNPGLTIPANITWKVGSGQDYSQQNGAQVTQSGGTISTATTTLTDTGASFTAALIGNAIMVAGTGITTTYTYITAVPTGTTLTLQTSPGTTGTSVTYNIGGGWADFWTNTATTPTVNIVVGNIIYILGSGTPNPASYVYDYTATATATLVAGALVIPGAIKYAADPATSGYKAPPDTTGGMPVVKVNTGASNFLTTTRLNIFTGVWFVANTMSSTKIILQNISAIGCVFDQFGNNVVAVSTGIVVAGSEVYSSNGGSGGTSAALSNCNTVISCNVHDCVGIGVAAFSLINSIIAKCASDGVSLNAQQANVINNTIDGNSGHGINIVTNWLIGATAITNNIISNQTGVGKFGINVTSGSGLTAVDLTGVNWNVYYNNTVDISNSGPYGPNDTHGGSNPYIAQSTENYSLV